MEKITEQILCLMSWDHYLPIIILTIIITGACLLCGVILLFFCKKPLTLIVGLLGLCFLISHISTFNEKDPNKLFEYQQKNDGILEIQSHNPLLKKKAEFKIIENNDKIILKNINTNQESEPLDKEEFFKTIKLNK